MSSRQLQRLKLNGALPLSANEDPGDECEEEEEENSPERPAFGGFGDESSESESNSESESDHEWIGASTVVEPEPGDTAAVENEEVRFLDALVAERRAEANADGTAGGSSGPKKPNLHALFEVDKKFLDVDAVMATQLVGGGGLLGGDLEQPVGRRGRRRGQQQQQQQQRMVRKNYTWGISRREDWVKAPSLIGGGIGMRVSASDGGKNTFTFKFAPELRGKDSMYSQVKALGDANILAMFLSNTPYHIEAMIQLVRLFIMMGVRDKAQELARRVIWVMESSALDAFRPHLGNCRLGPTRLDHHEDKANRLFLQALCMNMQLTMGLRLATSAARQAQTVLSLDPEGDPTHMWLRLDGLFMTAGLHTDLQDMYFFSATDGKPLPCQYLPGWAMSTALSVRKVGDVRTCRPDEAYALDANPEAASQRLDATVLLRRALEEHPYILHPLMKGEVPPQWGEAYSGSCALSRKLADTYAELSGEHWADDAVQSWLCQVASQVGAHQGPRSISITNDAPMQQYRQLEQVQAEYYQSLTQVLPPQMVDPHIFEMRFMDGRHRVPPKQLLETIQRYSEYRSDVTTQSRAQADMHTAMQQGRHQLDPSAPLMQLFWQSMLPWNDIGGEEGAPADVDMHALAGALNNMLDEEEEQGEGH